MPIIIIAGTASKETKTTYVTELSNKISNSVYLNIDNLYVTFSQSVSRFTDQYSYEQRIKHPSHEVVLELAHDNLSLNKIVILDGDFDYELASDLIEKRYPDLKKSGITVLYFHFSSDEILDIPADLKKLSTQQVMAINIIKDYMLNITSIFKLLTNTLTLPEEKAISEKILIMSAGLAGVGKTTHLKPICTRIPNSIYLDTDIATFPFLNSVQQPLASDYYGIHVKKQRYKVMFEFAADNLKFNRIAILDGCFGPELTSTSVKSHLAMPSYITTAIYFHCSGPTQFARVVKRNAKRDAKKIANFPPDRRDNLEKHLVKFFQVENIFCIDTEKEENLSENVETIFHHLKSPYLKSLAIHERKTAFDKSICKITTEEAQGGLKEFQLLLDRAKEKDNLLQEEKSKSFISSSVLLSKTRNSIWAEQRKVEKMDGFGLKLFSGTAHLWPYNSSDKDSIQTNEPPLRANSVSYRKF